MPKGLEDAGLWTKCRFVGGAVCTYPSVRKGIARDKQRVAMESVMVAE
jgi:hypothetical protein